MIIGYMRIATETETFKVQEDILKASDKIFKDTASISIKNKGFNKGFQEALDILEEGDTLYIESLYRVASNGKELLMIIEQLESKGAYLRSYEEQIDTKTENHVGFLTTLKIIAKLETQVAKERQLKGIYEAKKKGKYKGRKPIERPVNWDEVMYLWQKKVINSVEAMEKLGLAKNTFYKFLKEYKESIIEEVEGKK